MPTDNIWTSTLFAAQTKSHV